MVGLINFKIDSYTYKGINGNTLSSTQFPIPIKSPQVNENATLRFKNHTKFVDVIKKFTWVSDGSWGGLDRYWLDKNDQTTICKTFGITKKNQQDFYKLKIELIDVTLDLSYYSGKIDDTLDKLKKEINN